VFEVCLDVSSFACLHVFDGLGADLLVVEWRKEARLYLDAQFLHFGSVESEVLQAQRPDAHELEVSLEEVDQHRELVEPAFAQDTAPVADAVVILELAAFLEASVLVHVALEIFAVGVHRPELVNAYQLSVPAHAAQLDDEAAVGRFVADGLAHLLAYDVELPLEEALVHYVEACPAETPQHFHAVVRPVLAPGQREIYFSEDGQFGAGAVPEEMHPVDDVIERRQEGAKDDLFLEDRGAGVAVEVPAGGQSLV